MTISKPGAKYGYSIIIIIAIGIAAGWFGYKSVLNAGTDPHAYHIDYNVFYMAWESVLQTGGNPYAEQISPATPYLYPPVFAQLFSPLALLSVRAAAAVWYGIGVLALIASLVLSERLVRTENSRKIDLVLIAVSFIAISRFALDNLRMGQINLLVIAIVLLALYLFERKQIWPAAIVLATAVSFKLTPGLFLIYFLAKKEWRFVLKTSAVAGILNVASFLPMGRKAPEVFSYWYNLIILNRQGFGWGYHGNQSWRALVNRFFTDENTGTPHLQHINFTVNRAAADLIYYAGVLLIVALIAWAANATLSESKLDSRGNISPRAVEYGSVFCGMLMISSLSWKDHYVALILPYAAVINFVLYTKDARTRQVVLPLLLLSFLLCTMTNMGIIGGYWTETLETFSTVFIGVVLLFVALLFVRTRGLNVATESEIPNELRHRIEERVQA